MQEELPPGGPPPHVKDMSTDMKDTHNSIFFAAITTTRMPMIVTDPNQPDNPIVFANPAFMTMTGYDEEELVGRNCRLLQGPETDRETVAQVRQAIVDQREISVEILNYKKNKSSFWNALFVSPVFDENNNLLYCFASQLDVTRRREAEDALHQSQKMEAVGQLTGGIAHDFNNLLTVVSGFSEMLEINLDKPTIDIDRVKRYISNIKEATERGATLTSQLLAFARKQKLQGRIVNLKDLTDQLIPLIQQSLGSGIEIEVEHHEQSCNARIDSVQAESAIINIAANARDAMNGIGKLKIKTGPYHIDSADTIFGSVDHGDYVRLSITDNGSGMDPDVLSKITEPFFTTKGEGKGTGLGLSMVYGFIKQSNGALAIESTIGKGTTVHMLFKCESGEVEPVIVKAKRARAEQEGGQENILVVEDKVDVAEYAVAVLTDFGYNVIKAGNADEALEILNNTEIDVQLLFSDIVMPGSMNGVQLARETLRIRPNIKILLTTGYTDKSIDITDRYGVPFSLIKKPYKVTEIIERIKATFVGPDGIS